jgi:hypothetical protein
MIRGNRHDHRHHELPVSAPAREAEGGRTGCIGGRDGPVRGLGGMTTRLTRTDGALPSKQPNKHCQDEALWLAYRLNAALVSLVERRALRWNVTLGLAVIVLGLFAMVGLMIWAAWR